MRLVPRLLVMGVVLPLVGTTLAAAIASSLFRRSLVDALDDRLLAQAAVESVSLFDGPGQPHVHVMRSELASDVAVFATTTVLIDPAGHVVEVVPRDARLDELPRATATGTPVLSTAGGARSLQVGVDRPGDGIYTLHLVASLAPVEATMRSFHRSIGAAITAIALALLAVLYVQARGLARRVRELIAFVPRLRRAEVPPAAPARGGDELAELGDALADAASVLHRQRLAQERFLASAAHQLRTPLAVLRTEIDLALRRPREPHQLRDALAQAREEAERLAEVAKKLLDHEALRAHALDLRDVDLGAVVCEVVERHRSVAAERRIDLRGDAGPSLHVRCDALLVAQAVETLVDNALRFTPPGGHVTVRATRHDAVARLSVSDDGPGMPPELGDRAFEPFQRGTGPGSQTGLGLALVADVARRHDGRAMVIPTEVGATVALELPSSGPSG